MTVQMPGGATIAKIYDPCACCRVNQKVYDAQGAEIYEINGACCQLGAMFACADFHFDILEGGSVVGLIDKIFNGCEELCTMTNTFRIRFPPDADVNKKLALIGAAFLLDFVYWETRKN